MSIGIDFTSQGLIYSAKLHAAIPSSQSLFTDDDFIEVLNHNMVSEVIPLIKSVNEEYFVVKVDVPLVSGQDAYTFPTRALGGAMRDIVMVDTNNRELDLPRLQPELIKYGGAYYAQRIFGIYLEGDHAVFYPTMQNPPQGSFIRFKYERRPNDLCLLDNAGKILSINVGLKKITLDKVPAVWTTDTTVDIMLPVPQFTSIADDVVITQITGHDLTLSALPTGIAVGQWVAESMTTPVAQLPYEAHKLIEIYGAAALLQASKDTEALNSMKQEIEEAKDALYKIITPRVEGSPVKVINRNSIFDYNRGWNGYLTVRP
jgi:hypothetical protein